MASTTTAATTLPLVMALALFSVAARAAAAGAGAGPSAARAAAGGSVAFAVPSSCTCSRSATHAAAAVGASCRSAVCSSSSSSGSSIRLHRPFGGGLSTFAPPRAIATASVTSLFSTAADASSSLDSSSETNSDPPQPQPVPITLLAGFLGSGKTTALKNLLENRQGVKVGVIVNDVAAVNIDAKLIANPGNDGAPSNIDDTESGEGEGTGASIETDYGGTVELQNGCACCSLADELLTSVQSVMDGRDLDAVVVELSGVADPVAVKQNWDMARMTGHPATKLADVNRVVTVIDSSTFGTDWMTWDTAGDRDEWTEQGDACSGQRKVPELLAEQVEAADLLIVNKIDLAGPDQMKTATAVALAINDGADLIEAEFGKVKPSDILGDLAKASGAAAAVVEKKKEQKEEDSSSSHSHSHDHDSSCDDPDCTDSSHSHSHDHAASSCDDPDCTEDHEHSHDHADSSCTDPDCTDTSHSHSHSHETSTDRLGISNFVYKSSRPFNSQRLLMLLNNWPVPIKDELDIIQLEKASKEGAAMGDGVTQDSPFAGVLRSKGFCWLSPVVWSDTGGDAWRHDTAMYWSHAGKHFGINTAGKWWGTIPKDRIKEYFTGNMKEYDRIMKEDWVSDEWGDRRQELVFIGAGIDEAAITKALDDCLMDDEEMEKYLMDLQNYEQRTLTALANGGPSLFDLAGNDHMDVEENK